MPPPSKYDVPPEQRSKLFYPRRRPTGHVCPSCDSDLYVYRSRTRTRWERFVRMLGYFPHRCDPCGYRFLARKVRRGSEAEEEADPGTK